MKSESLMFFESLISIQIFVRAFLHDEITFFGQVLFNGLEYASRVLENYSGEIWRSTRHPLTLFSRGDEKFDFFCLVSPSDPSIRTEFRGSSVYNSYQNRSRYHSEH